MFLDVLDGLLRDRGINKHILAKESGIPYTTIDGFYKKGYENVKLSTLMKLCTYFNVSLDFLIRPNIKKIELSPKDEGIVLYEQLDDIDKANVKGYMRGILQSDKYKQDASELA